MHLFTAIMMACVAVTNARQVVNASTSSLETDPDSTVIPSTTSSTVAPTESAKNAYDCDGSSMCPTLHVKACDDAINYKLIRDDNVNYGAVGSGKPRVGECHGIATDFGCGILIQGPVNCTRTGNEIWWDYQDIRDSGCHHCGHKYWGDWGCKTTIDYFPVCGIWH